MVKKNRTHPRWLKARLTAKDALDLRLKGLSYAEIAETLKDGEGGRQYASPGAVYNAIMRLMKYHEHESVEELRQVETARLDRMFEAIWQFALAGGKDAIELALKIQRRRAQLLGLDVPQEVHWKGELEIKRVLLLKIGNRPPRLIDLSAPDLDLLSDEELQVLREMPEGEVKLLPEKAGRKEERE